jgi:anthranilate phosphoribosyltransferase
MNSAAALLAGDKVDTLQQGAALAKEIIDSGSAHKKLQELVEFSRITN